MVDLEVDERVILKSINTTGCDVNRILSAFSWLIGI
jgi:hypothetical protein